MSPLLYHICPACGRSWGHQEIDEAEFDKLAAGWPASLRCEECRNAWINTWNPGRNHPVSRGRDPRASTRNE